jgi:hypothetical protein
MTKPVPATRTLKLPDGGTINMQIPPELGAAVVALDGAILDNPQSKTLLILAGAGVGALLVWWLLR